MKRAFDIVLSLAGIIMSLPFWPIFMLLILLEDGWPIFFVQDRVGKGGRIFKGVKFRSMIKRAEDAAGPLQAHENDTRVTRIGSFLRSTAMDELPQLLNILIGDMSFVGPRALRPVEIDVADTKPKSIWEFPGFRERCAVVPGLTGVAQVLAPRDIPRSEKFKYDIWYIKNRSFRLDIEIILLSFLVTFSAKWEDRGDRFAFLTKRLRNKLLRDKALD